MNNIDYIIKPLSSDSTIVFSEINQCIDIQCNVGWEPDIVPSHIFRADTINLVDNEIDLGFVLIAKSLITNKLIGFARVTFTADNTKLWLHEIAVSKTTQSKDVGFSLMTAIKTKSLELNAKNLYFTYDPMEGQNGNLYLSKCGAKAIKVYPNLYGKLNDAANGNRNSHRFLICWDLINDVPKQFAKQDINNIVEINENTNFNLQIGKIEIPYNIKKLSVNEAKNWEDKTHLTLIKHINILKYKVVYLFSDKIDEKNYLIIEK